MGFVGGVGREDGDLNSNPVPPGIAPGAGVPGVGVTTTIGGMRDMLSRSDHLPEVEFAPGETVTVEGAPSGEIWVLVSGALAVRKGGELVNSISRPGAVVGEISVLLDTAHGATVEAAVPSILRVAHDGHAFLGQDPELLRQVAVGLAERLNLVTTYLADLKHQYGDAPGLSMVAEVVGRLAAHQQPAARSGSARDPDPEY